MNLYEGFPSKIEINGSEYPIITDFREWLKWFDMWDDDSIDLEIKILFSYEMILSTCDEPFDDILESFKKFLNMGNNDDVSADNKPTIDYTQDSGVIIADFMREYQLDLVSIKTLHWWYFRVLMDNLSDKSGIKQRIYYRSVDLSEIKDKEERKRIRRIKNQYKIRNKEMTDEEIGNALF